MTPEIRTLEAHAGWRLVGGACLAIALSSTPHLAAVAAGDQPAKTSPLRFEISFPAAAHAAPVTGRVYVMISRTAKPEPRLQVEQTGIPIFGRDVDKLAPGKPVVIDENVLGYPINSLRDFPAGDYYVQGFVNIYTDYRRADGHVVWFHEDQWEGQHWERSPGNLHSDVQQVHIDPAQAATIRLVASKVIPPVQIPQDTEWVKRFRFQSPMLTKFWGRPVYLGATVLLPREYEKGAASYAVNYIQGHFSLNPPLGFEVGNAIHREWIRDDFPRMLVVTFQHPNPYYDDSYAVNSVNVGPYGDAIRQELIPEIEKRFRAIREPYARILSGGSTGGWEAFALQVFHPDFFGGTWVYCPDPVDFTEYEGVDLYNDDNAFYKQYEWRRVPTPNIHDTQDRIQLTVEQKNLFEHVSGTKGRSGRQMDIWSAVFGPVGRDGYYEPVFDKLTGVINKQVARYWKENYDLRYQLEKNWSTLGPKLAGKLHVYAGDMDTYYLNNAVRKLQAWMRTTKNPHDEGFFLYGDGKPHCWSGPETPAERLRQMADFVAQHAPSKTSTPNGR
ncbi:MAG: hypothetical protein HYZ58_08020 [Acidobacteria bacterium]|nr:hypothetical protein [Acidobacteriota bacterium]